ncbi:hypothetical protein JCM8547_001753 [Rhodosporidiobolus lusitaniae]
MLTSGSLKSTMLSTRAPLRLPSTFSRRLFSSSSSSLAPPYLYTPLPSRALLSIKGADAQKLLQGLVSNDVRRLAQPGDEEGKMRVIYANLLKADGRYMHDVMLYPGDLSSTSSTSSPDSSSPPTPSYFLEHDSSFTPTLRTYLKRHLLRSKAKLGKSAEETVEVNTAWRNEGEESTLEEVKAAEEWLESRKAGLDPRVLGMGYRWVGAKEGEKPPPELFKPVTPSHFHLHRLSLGIPEGPSDFPALPLEANIDLMNGVDYRKGCYVGQELTARTHHKGIVRKRGMIFRLFREGEDIPTEPLFSPSSSLRPYPNLFPLPPPGSSLTLLSSSSPRARPSGKLGSSLSLLSPNGVSTLSLAYGSVKLEHLGEGTKEDDGVFVVKAPVGEEGKLGEGREAPEQGDGAGENQEEGGRWLAKAFMPDWLAFKLEEEEIRKGSH